MSAVSAKPFLAPWVELKYSRAVNPSLKFEIIGVSIISPEGFAIKPRIPANCFIWAAEPLAPESAIINTEFKLLVLLSKLFLVGEEIFFIISIATKSVHLDQASTTLLYFSPLVINPSAYWFSYSSIIFLVSFTKVCFFSGIIKSSFPNDIPDLNAYLKPRSFILSQKITVLFCPQNLKTRSMISETCFFDNILSIKENLMFDFFGKILANKNLPAVLVCFSNTMFPFSSIVSNLDIILEWTFIELQSKACSISDAFTK